MIFYILKGMRARPMERGKLYCGMENTGKKCFNSKELEIFDFHLP